MTVRKNIFFLLVLLLSTHQFLAQAYATAIVKIDTNRIRIGEQAQLTITLNYNKNKINRKIIWPAVGDTIRKEIDVVSKTNPKSTKAENSSTGELTQNITITSFDSGFWVIPPFKFFIEGDSNAFAETEALLLEVQMVPTDTAEASLKDIKPIFEEKWDWKAYLPYLYWTAAVVAILAMAIYIGYRYARNRKKKPEIKSSPKEPAHILALRELNTIRQIKIWKEGKYKEYYTSITDVLRVYLEGRFGIAAMELTSDEINQVLRSQVIDEERKRKMRQILELSDFVKFAKATPIEMENDITLQNAFDFVEGTARNNGENKHADQI